MGGRRACAGARAAAGVERGAAAGAGRGKATAGVERVAAGAERPRAAAGAGRSKAAAGVERSRAIATAAAIAVAAVETLGALLIHSLSVCWLLDVFGGPLQPNSVAASRFLLPRVTSPCAFASDGGVL